MYVGGLLRIPHSDPAAIDTFRHGQSSRLELLCSEGTLLRVLYNVIYGTDGGIILNRIFCTLINSRRPSGGGGGITT